METMQYGAPAFVEVYVEYEYTKALRILRVDSFEIRDVTFCLRLKPSCYSFESITTIFLPVDLAGYDNVIKRILSKQRCSTASQT
jgi:hypothetical protein